MNWLLKALSSSIGKKFVMGITGLLLCGFLVAHLAGNLLLYVPDKVKDGESHNAYNDYAHALHEQEGLLMVAETGLFALFAAHIALAFVTARENRNARPVSYGKVQSKQKGRKIMDGARPDTWMFVTGAIIFAFLILHLSDFKLELRPDVDYSGKEPFDKALMILQTPLSAVMYCVGAVAIIAHLSHGFSSAFQSLGVNHPKYNRLIKCVGILFAVAVGAGFLSFPVWANFIMKSSQ